MVPTAERGKNRIKKKLDRRQFIKQSSAATVLSASVLGASDSPSFDSPIDASIETQYRGPLSDLDVSRRHFESRDFSLSGYDNVKPALGFSATNIGAAQGWQKQARRKLGELVGGFPRTRCALDAAVVAKKEFPSS